MFKFKPQRLKHKTPEPNPRPRPLCLCELVDKMRTTKPQGRERERELPDCRCQYSVPIAVDFVVIISYAKCTYTPIGFYFDWGQWAGFEYGIYQSNAIHFLSCLSF